MTIDINYLTFFNPEWSGKVASKDNRVSNFKRELFYQVEKKLGGNFIITVSGVRRVGKSVLCEQLFRKARESEARESLDQNYHYNFFRFSFDTDEFDLIEAEYLKELLAFYFNNILKKNPSVLTEPVYIFLDEIQNVRGWPAVIKTFYDLNKNIKFILTGSSSLYLAEGSESLAGRVLDYELGCLSFEEFLSLIAYDFSDDFDSSSAFIRKVDDLWAIRPRIIPLELSDLFKKFIQIGAFPDTALAMKRGDDVKEILHFIKSGIVDKIIGRDFRKYFRLEEIAADRKLFAICGEETGSFYSLTRLSTETKLSQITVKKHLEIFEKTKLISTISKFDRKLRREVSASKKWYLAHPAIGYALAGRLTTEDTAYLGHAVETYLFNRLKLLSSKIYVELGRGDQEEVDFYLRDLNLMIESKFTSKIDQRDFKYLRSRSEQLKTHAVVATKNIFERSNQSDKKDILFLPAMLF